MDKFEVTDHPHQFFNELRWNDKLAIAISRELSLSRNQTQTSHFDSVDSAHCFDHPNIIYSHSLSILTRKNFPLINELNQFIERATETGLFDKWVKRYRSFRGEQLQIQYTIGLTNFIIVMTIYSGMVSLAFIIIVIERFVYGKVRSLNSNPFWRYIEMAIDPYRHFLLEDLDWAH